MSFDEKKALLDWFCENGYEVYGDEICKRISVSYDEEISDMAIKECVKSGSTREKLEEILWERATDYYMFYEKPQLFENIAKTFKFFEGNEQEIAGIIDDVQCYYNLDDFEQNVHVVIAVDTGDGNYDFTCNNILNYYGEGKFNETSSIKWLCKQQGKYQEVANAVKVLFREDRNYVGRKIHQDVFVESVLQELENLSSHMGMLIFLVTMKLSQFLELRDAIEGQAKENANYDARKNTGKGCVIITSNSDCGLFDSWNGGGSCLEITLDKDVEIPMRFLYDAWVDGTNMHGRWDPDSVYGLSGEAWKGSVKAINVPVNEIA